MIAEVKTIDDLYGYLGNMTTDQTNEDWVEGIGDAVTAIKELQPDLELGMRRALMDELYDKLEATHKVPAINQHGKDFQKGFKRAMFIIEENRKIEEKRK